MKKISLFFLTFVYSDKYQFTSDFIRKSLDDSIETGLEFMRSNNAHNDFPQVVDFFVNEAVDIATSYMKKSVPVYRFLKK